MIIGIGSDIVNISRIKKLYEQFGDRFINRVFSEAEIKNAQNKSVHKIAYFAKRFAAKEAFIKALGTGFRNGLRFKDVEILNDLLGKPEIHLHAVAKEKLASKVKKSKIHLSLSDDEPFAQAFVVIESLS